MEGPELRRYGGAVLGMALAILGRFLIDPLLGDTYPFITFYFAVVATAWLAGFGPALLATALGAAAGISFFIEPRFSFALDRVQDLFGLAVFLALGVMTAALSRRAEQAGRLQAALAERSNFAFLAENSHDFIGICDADRVPFFVNKAGMQMVGLDSLEQAIGTRIEEFFFPEDRDYIVNEFFPRVFRDGVGEVEVRFRHFKTGEPLWMTYGVVALREPDGRLTGFATVSRNIDEHKRLAEALIEADRRKDDAIAVLAHELRNPLAPIRNAVQILSLAENDPRALRKAREILERQVRQMVRLVDDLLDVSRIGRGKIEIRPERIRVSEVVRTALEISRPHIEKAGHQLQVELPPSDLELDADPARLAQVLSNLLGNAAKYMEPGGRIQLSVCADNGHAVIRVRDEGIGIPAELLERIFEPFVQVDGSLNRSQGGLGIGLALVRSLVSLHGGTVTAHSDGPGTGSELVVRLPAAPSAN